MANHTAKYIMEAAHDRDEYAKHAHLLADAIKTFLKGKRGKEFNGLRTVLASYEREVELRKPPKDHEPESEPEPDLGWH